MTIYSRYGRAVVVSIISIGLNWIIAYDYCLLGNDRIEAFHTTTTHHPNNSENQGYARLQLFWEDFD